jgi:hypothetical protein
VLDELNGVSVVLISLSHDSYIDESELLCPHARFVERGR